MLSHFCQIINIIFLIFAKICQTYKKIYEKLQKAVTNQENNGKINLFRLSVIKSGREDCHEFL